MKAYVLRVSLILVLCAVSLCLLIGCDKTPNKPSEEPVGEPYTLQFTSNGDGTCSVGIYHNPAYTDLYDVTIPEKSPKGDTVTHLENTMMPYAYAVPMACTPESFDQLIKAPLKAHLGLSEYTDEELNSLNNASQDILEKVFQYNKILRYYTLKSLPENASEEFRNSILENSPLVQYTDYYECVTTFSYDVKEMNTNFTQQAGLTYQNVLDMHAEINALIQEHAVDMAPLPTSYGFGIRSLTLPNTLTDIDSGAFRSMTALESLTIPEGVTEIKDTTFRGCSALKEVVLPNSLTKIGISAFAECTSLQEIQIPEGITCIEDSVFYECTSLKSVKLPSNLTMIRSASFAWCFALTDIDLPESLTTIDSHAFAGSALTSITLPVNLQYLASDAFAQEEIDTNGDDTYDFIGCPIEEAVIPTHVADSFNRMGTLKKITVVDTGVTPKNAFYGFPNLQEVVISDNMTVIADSMFANCPNLTEVFIPSSVTKIGSSAFYKCSSLEGIHYAGTMEQWNAIELSIYWSSAYNTTPPSITIICSDGTIEA